MSNGKTIATLLTIVLAIAAEMARRFPNGSLISPHCADIANEL